MNSMIEYAKLAWGEATKEGVPFVALLSSFASIATCFAAYLAFKSVQQVYRLNVEQKIEQRKRSTLELVASPGDGIAYLSRNPMRLRSKQYPYLKWEVSDIEDNFLARKSGLSLKTIEKILESTSARIPLSYHRSEFKNIANQVNANLLGKPFDLQSNIQSENAKLFNKIEDIANAANSSLIDVDLLDEMYGNMLLAIYKDHSEWIAFVKRRLGFRTYDQLEILFDNIIWRHSIRFSFGRWRVIRYLILSGPFGWRMAIRLYREGDLRSQSLTRNAFVRKLRLYGFEDAPEKIFTRALILKGRINREVIRRERWISARNSHRLYLLFKDCYMQTGGVWPVGIGQGDVLEKHEFKNWLGSVIDTWDYLIIAESRSSPRSALMGFIAISSPSSVNKNKERWTREIIAAGTKTGAMNEREIFEYFKNLGLPMEMTRGKLEIDFGKVCQLRSFYVHSKCRDERSSESLGRKILRKAISFCRYELSSVVILSVIADEQFSVNAIRLYVAEGGAYLGSVRDNLKTEGHLMHWFIF